MKRFALLVALFLSTNAQARYYESGLDREAVYMATLKAVADYKIDDEENLKRVEELRQDENFNKQLRVMLAKLNNSKYNKDAKNRRVYQILQNAGKKIYEELN